MDDHIGAAISFEAMFDFLHHPYFTCAIFGPVYLAPHKTFIFTDQLDFLGLLETRMDCGPYEAQKTNTILAYTNHAGRCRCIFLVDSLLAYFYSWSS